MESTLESTFFAKVLPQDSRLLSHLIHHRNNFNFVTKSLYKLQMKKFSNVIDHQQFDLSINPKVYSSSLQLDRSINSSLTQLYLQLTLKADSRKWKVGAQWYLSTTRTAYSSPSLYASCLFSVRVISRRLRLITPTSTLIFLDIEKKHHPIIF